MEKKEDEELKSDRFALGRPTDEQAAGSGVQGTGWWTDEPGPGGNEEKPKIVARRSIGLVESIKSNEKTTRRER